jgi:hydroxymethylbilane synthase
VKPLRIGTRGSLLAQWQANFIRSKLLEVAGQDAEIIVIKTSGDKFAQGPVAQLGLKGIFIKELEEALLAGEIDLAVHSAKDVPTETTARLAFPAVCRREDVRDCIVSSNGSTLSTLRQGARVGTSSLRRQSQLRHLRPDLDLRELRGNVDTRLRKVESGEYDAVVVAKAGLDRLGLSHRISEVLAPDVCLPAVGQGALAVESRAADRDTLDIADKLDDEETRWAVAAERTLLAELQGGCQVPIGAWARVERGQLVMDACVVSLDGTEYVRERGISAMTEATSLGQTLAKRLIDAGARGILEQLGRHLG